MNQARISSRSAWVVDDRPRRSSAKRHAGPRRPRGPRPRGPRPRLPCSFSIITVLHTSSLRASKRIRRAKGWRGHPQGREGSRRSRAGQLLTSLVVAARLATTVPVRRLGRSVAQRRGGSFEVHARWWGRTPMAGSRWFTKRRCSNAGVWNHREIPVSPNDGPYRAKTRYGEHSTTSIKEEAWLSAKGNCRM